MNQLQLNTQQQGLSIKRDILYSCVMRHTQQSSAMERKRSNIETLVVMMMVMALMVSVMSHAPPGVCIDRCLKECKGSGLGAASCVKYCPVHCLPPDTSKDHYCNLGCMLDQCAKYITDDKKMTDCVLKCRKYHCNIRAKSTKIVV